MRAIDLFAGWGGFTEGATAAGIDVVWASNHWPLAVQAHALNHPGTIHTCQDLQQANWADLPEYDLLLASPACQGHAQAAQPARKADSKIRQRHDDLRATAWAVVSAADATRPEALVVENVVDFRRWELYPVWRLALETLGYHLQEVVLTASWHGVPQRRRRMFVIGHRRPVEAITLPRKRREAAFGPCIDWKVRPVGDGAWKPVSEGTKAVQGRIAKGRRNHGSRFLTQHTSNHPGVSLDEPIRTITTKDQWCVVRGDEYRPLTIREYARGMGFRDDYSWPETATKSDAVKGLGNAVCPPLVEQLITRVADAA
jgi:DNA (cytosine-5)-methyltransferase 1